MRFGHSKGRVAVGNHWTCVCACVWSKDAQSSSATDANKS